MLCNGFTGIADIDDRSRSGPVGQLSQWLINESFHEVAYRVLGHFLLPAVLFLLLVSGIQSAASFVDDEMLSNLRSRFSEAAEQRGLVLKELLADLLHKDVSRQLDEINSHFNRFEYREDLSHWSEEDYWATPEEFIGRNAGDCEDYVIAKYFALRALGVPDDRLYLTYVKAVRENVAHMVLSYFESPESVPLILDNYNKKILPANLRTDLLPVYSFNASSLFLTNASAGLGQMLPSDRISNNKWRKLLQTVSGAVK